MEHYKNLDIREISGEMWEWIPGCKNDYKVSAFGRIISYLKYSDGRVRRQVISGGYLKLQIYINGVCKTKQAHRLVAETFIPNPENKLEVNHINGVRTDNRVENLEWTTPSENHIHAYRVLKRVNNLEKQKGDTHYKAKIKSSDVIKIRELALEGKKHNDIASIYGVARSVVTRIISGTRWSHVK